MVKLIIIDCLIVCCSTCSKEICDFLLSLVWNYSSPSFGMTRDPLYRATSASDAVKSSPAHTNPFLLDFETKLSTSSSHCDLHPFCRLDDKSSTKTFPLISPRSTEPPDKIRSLKQWLLWTAPRFEFRGITEDLTSAGVLPPILRCRMQLVPLERCILSGLSIFFFRVYIGTLKCSFRILCGGTAAGRPSSETTPPSLLKLNDANADRRRG